MHIELDELDHDGVVLDLDLDDARAAGLASSRLLDVRPERRGWRLTPRGLVGSTRVGDLQVDVRPKERVGLGSVLFMLGYARDPGFEPGLVDAAEDEDLWPALAESLARLARTALAPGVLQGYLTVDEALRTVRGRIRIGDQLARRPGQLLPIEVTYDEFTVDIAENQVLRTALRRMLAVPRVPDAARSALGHLDGQLAGVTVLSPTPALPRWRQSRVNGRYVPALRLAELVLHSLSAETGRGTYAMASFAVDMARVFEQFVETALREALTAYPGRTVGQYGTRLDQPDGSGVVGLPMRVDVVHLVHDVPTWSSTPSTRRRTAQAPTRTQTTTRCWPTARRCACPPRGWCTRAPVRHDLVESSTPRSRSWSTPSTSVSHLTACLRARTYLQVLPGRAAVRPVPSWRRTSALRRSRQATRRVTRNSKPPATRLTTVQLT